MRRIAALQIAIAQPRAAIRLIGLLSWASAGLSGLLAWEHATFRGPICGAGLIPHCGWCFGAAGFALVGLAAFRASGDPTP